MESSVLKALNLLQIMITANEALGATALAQMTDQHKSNVHRMLQILCAAGLAYRVDDSGTYRPSLKMWELGSSLISKFDIVSVAHPYLEQLVAVTHETAHLSVLEGLDVVYIDRVESPHPILVRTNVGSRAPAQCVATGKVFLAQLASLPTERLASQMQKHAENSVLDMAALEQQLVTVREEGYAMTHSEWRQGVRGFAAPIPNLPYSYGAAIGLSGPEERMLQVPREVLGEVVKTTAELVASRIAGNIKVDTLADALKAKGIKIKR